MCCIAAAKRCQNREERTISGRVFFGPAAKNPIGSTRSLHFVGLQNSIAVWRGVWRRERLRSRGRHGNVDAACVKKRSMRTGFPSCSVDSDCFRLDVKSINRSDVCKQPLLVKLCCSGCIYLQTSFSCHASRIRRRCFS